MRAPPTLRLSNAAELRAQGLEAIARGTREIDLSGLSDVDSSAIAVLLAWQRAARAANVRLTFVGPSTNVLALAKLYSVTDLIFAPAPTTALNVTPA